MKTVIICACVMVLLSCQKEINFPPQADQPTVEVTVPESPEQEPEPEPDPGSIPETPDPLDPPPGTVSESVYLRNLTKAFNSDYEYKLAKVYSDQMNLWLKVPEWAKDDIHIFGNRGIGSIQSSSKQSPDKPFTTIQQNWSAYADGGIKLTWLDVNYEPATYTLVYAVPGDRFKAFRIEKGIKIYYVFKVVNK